MTTIQDKDTQIDVEINGFDPSEFEQDTAYGEPALDWQTPLPIQNTLLPVLPMQPEMLPEALRAWLTDIAYRMKCPLDFVAAACVVMLSSLIGTRLSIKPKSKDPWAVIPNLWGAVVGDPSTAKSPSIKEVFRPLLRLIDESSKLFSELMLQYEAEQVTHDAQKKVYQSQEQDRLKGKPVSNPVEYPEAPTKPTERRYMTNDATVEKMGDLLNENPAGLLQFRDELIGLLAGWDRSGREQDRAFYLEAWNGSGSITIDRIGRGTTHVNNVCLSLFGGIQPAKLMGYLRAATEYDNDGFVQRLQVAVYPDKPQWHYVDEYADKQARDRAFDVIRAIDTSDFSNISYDADEYNPFPYTRFDAQAQEIFKQWLIDWETQVLPQESGLLLEHFTKYRSLMPSLALIFHVADCVIESTTVSGNQKQLVSAEAATMAIQWIEYLQSHARRIYGLLDAVSATAAKDLLRHLKAGHLPDGFKVREVVKKGWAGLTTADSVDSALSELIVRNWIIEVMPSAPPTGRPEAPYYRIHPQLLSQND